MIVFTCPLESISEGLIGSDKFFISPKEIKGFKIHDRYEEEYAYVEVMGVPGTGWFPYKSKEIAEKHVREAIKAIMYDEDYEFPDYEEQQ